MLVERSARGLDTFIAREEKFQSLLNELEKAHTQNEGLVESSALSALNQFLSQLKSSRSPSRFDPRDLPVRWASKDANAKKAASTESVLSTRTEATIAGDEAQVSDAIRQKAAQLGNNPVKIFNWVRNNVEYLPVYGATQGSEATLKSLRGGDADIACLLVALLRAAGLEARFVTGNVTLPIGSAMNWVGGVTNPQAVVSLLSQGGYPVTATMEGGQLTRVTLGHVWVEAHLDFYPARGSVNRQADTWVPMDASFKTYSYKSGMDLSSIPLQVNAMVAQTGGVADDPSGGIAQLNTAAAQNYLDSYLSQLQSYVVSTKTSATVGDVIGEKTIVQANRQTLDGSLPFQSVSLRERSDSLAAGLQHSLTVELFENADDVNLGSPSAKISATMPALAGKRLALDFAPATPDDAKVMGDAWDAQAASFNAGLVHVVPKLKIEEQSVESAPAVAIGTSLAVRVTVSSPAESRQTVYSMSAGDIGVLALTAHGVTPAEFQDRTSAHAISGGDGTSTILELLHQAGMAWWAEKGMVNDVASGARGTVHTQMPSHAMVSRPIRVSYLFGVPSAASYGGDAIDARSDVVAGESKSMNADSRRQMLEVIGRLGSSLEAAVFDVIHRSKSSHSVSTMTLLGSAANLGIPIYRITGANVEAAIPLLSISPDVVQDIRNATAAGQVVIIPQHDMTVGSFVGTGYIIEDPVTGAGAYLLSGGTAGGQSEGAESVYPLPQFPDDLATSIMIGAAQRSQPAAPILPIVALAGVTVPPTTDPRVAAAVLAILLLLYILSKLLRTLSGARTSTEKVFRHWSELYILESERVTHAIWGSTDGTFGPGVYFGRADDELRVPPKVGAFKKITCPPSDEEVHSVWYYYMLDGPYDTLPPGYYDVYRGSAKSAFIDITIDTDEPGLVGPKLNDFGGEEWIFKSPPLTPPFPSAPRPVKVFTDDQLVGTCPPT